MRGIGHGLAADVLNTLLSHGLLMFDIGIVGPGALAAVFYLRGGEGTQPRCYSLCPPETVTTRCVMQLRISLRSITLKRGM